MKSTIAEKAFSAVSYSEHTGTSARISITPSEPLAVLRFAPKLGNSSRPGFVARAISSSCRCASSVAAFSRRGVSEAVSDIGDLDGGLDVELDLSSAQVVVVCARWQLARLF